MAIPVDATRLESVATGIVAPVYEWVEKDDGKRSQSSVQAVSEDSRLPLWQVEMSRTAVAFGRPSTKIYTVTVGSKTEPQITPYSRVAFENLQVDFYPTKSGVGESWSAEGIADDFSDLGLED